MKVLDGITIYNVDEWHATTMMQYDVLPRPDGNQRTRVKREYIDCVCAFDIETSRIKKDDQSFMYIWQFCVNGEYVVIGRTWEEFFNFLQRMREHCAATVVVYVHNLSYEFAFIKGRYQFHDGEIFALDTRRIAKFSLYDNAFEFRCSAIHSNMNLDTFTTKFGAIHSKRTGSFDYDKMRYPWTRLSDDELRYCVYDVQGLVEALKNEMQHDGDSLYTIPLTSTGYVRRDCKKAVRDGVSYNWLRSQMPSFEVYNVLREAFRGGNTHANRFYVRKKIKGVKCTDRSSSYPDVQLNCKFPISEWKREPHCTLQHLQKLHDDGYAYLIRISVESVRLKDDRRGDPYIPLSKIRYFRGELVDNGRILSADYFETTLTDIDFEIFATQYEWETLYIMDCFSSHYGFLPGSIRELIKHYYRLKTELKGNPDLELLYMKSKNKLNSIYGLSVMNPLRSVLTFDEDSATFLESDSEDPELDLLKYNRTAFFNYSWGVYTTAWARYRLFEAIESVGVEDFVYCDTDSVYFVGDHSFDDYNFARIADSKDSGAFAIDANGVTHYMGVLEPEHVKDPIKEFKTLGAKKYAYTDSKGLHITIAGVVKGKGAAELGSIDNFREGFTFYDAGGLEAVYNDNVMRVYHIGKHELVVTDNVCLKPSSYTLGISAEYERILDGIDMLGVIDV